MDTDTDALREAGDRMIARMDDVDALPGTKEARARSYELLALTPNTTVVDLGCGPGLATAELAALGHRAIGVDLNPRVVEVAAERHPAADFRVGSVFHLPLADGEASAYRADKLYHLIEDQPAALAEAKRVLSPGGRIVLVGPQWDAVTVDGDDHALTRRIVHGRADAFTDQSFTRRARALLLDAGFVDVAVEVQTAVFTDPPVLRILRSFATIAASVNAVTQDEAERWYADQEARAARDRLLVGFPVWFASGTRA